MNSIKIMIANGWLEISRRGLVTNTSCCGDLGMDSLQAMKLILPIFQILLFFTNSSFLGFSCLLLGLLFGLVLIFFFNSLLSFLLGSLFNLFLGFLLLIHSLQLSPLMVFLIFHIYQRNGSFILFLSKWGSSKYYYWIWYLVKKFATICKVSYLLNSISPTWKLVNSSTTSTACL